MQLAAAIDENGCQLAGCAGASLGTTAKAAQTFRQDRKPGRRIGIATQGPLVGNALVCFDVPSPSSALFFVGHAFSFIALLAELHQQMASLDGVRVAVQREARKEP